MRTLALTLFAAIALPTALPAAWATEPPTTDPVPEIPRMTREEARTYVAQERLALVPSSLVHPILTGNVEMVEALLSAGVDVNDRTDMPQPVLHLAASTCAGKELETGTILALVEVLLSHGARVNEPTPSELSALMIAAQQCPAPVVRRLIRAGANMQFRTSLGITPLSMAFLVGNLDAAEALIEAGARLSPEAAGKILEGKKDDARAVALVNKARGK